MIVEELEYMLRPDSVEIFVEIENYLGNALDVSGAIMTLADSSG